MPQGLEVQVLLTAPTSISDEYMSRLTTPEQEQIKTLYKGMYRYLSSGEAAEEGNPIIAAARAAALAKDAGLDNIAEAISSKYIPNVKGMPSFKEFRKGYEENKDKEGFKRFETGVPDPRHPTGAIGFRHPGTKFSNAAGSYAFALDAAANGDAAFKNGGDREPTGNWAFDALTAAGFPEQAKILQEAVIAGIQLETVKVKSK